MSGSVGRGVDRALGQWKQGKEDAKARKEMEGFLLKLTKVAVPKRKTTSKRKGKKK